MSGLLNSSFNMIKAVEWDVKPPTLTIYLSMYFQYVFGSLLSRDNTYRIMFTVWKSLTDPVSQVLKQNTITTSKQLYAGFISHLTRHMYVIYCGKKVWSCDPLVAGWTISAHYPF